VRDCPFDHHNASESDDVKKKHKKEPPKVDARRPSFVLDAVRAMYEGRAVREATCTLIRDKKQRVEWTVEIRDTRVPWEHRLYWGVLSKEETSALYLQVSDAIDDALDLDAIARGVPAELFAVRDIGDTTPLWQLSAENPRREAVFDLRDSDLDRYLLDVVSARDPELEA
jgi:hypothetical protein